MNKKIKSIIKIGDVVKIISGQNKGLIGIVNAIFLKKSIIYVKEVPKKIKFLKNLEKKELEVPIHVSNVALWDFYSSTTSKTSSFYYGLNKYRFFKKSGNIIL